MVDHEKSWEYTLAIKKIVDNLFEEKQGSKMGRVDKCQNIVKVHIEY